MIIVEQSASLISHTPNPEVHLERCGRVCYRSEERITADSAPRFVEMICKRNHESVLEHASATIYMTTDRGIAQEITRHRIGSYSMESTRYVNYHKKGEIRCVPPIGMDNDQHHWWLDAMHAAEKSYNAMVALGCTPEVARDVLPLDLACDLVVTYNFRQWKWFIKQRSQKAAHPKIRVLTALVKDLLISIAPTVFKETLE